MTSYIEGKDLNLETLINEEPQKSELAIYTIRKSELPKLQGLQHLPLQSLELRWLSSPDLTSVPLPATLENLMVWHSSKLKSLNGIEAAANLKSLVLEDNGPLEDLTSVSKLKNLMSYRLQVVSPLCKN